MTAWEATHPDTPGQTRRVLSTFELSADDDGRWCVSSKCESYTITEGRVERLDSRSATLTNAQRAADDAATQLLAGDLVALTAFDVEAARKRHGELEELRRIADARSAEVERLRAILRRARPYLGLETLGIPEGTFEADSFHAIEREVDAELTSPAPGPRFVAMRGCDVPPGAFAEGYASRHRTGDVLASLAVDAAYLNAHDGSIVNDFAGGDFGRDGAPWDFAIVDTRPSEPRS